MENGKTWPRPIPIVFVGGAGEYNPQKIFPAIGFLGKTYALRLSGCISPIPCGLGWRMARPRDHPQRISKKNGRSGSRPGWSPVPASRFLGNEVASINLPLRLSGCISPLYPVGRGWKMGRHDRDQSLSYLLAELESSNPQKIFPASGFLGKTYALRLSGCISPIPCGLGWRMGRHDPTPRPSAKDFEKNGRSGIRPGWSPVPASRFLGNEVASINLPLRLSGCISPLYPVGSGMEDGKT